jgi:hypothetical protein
LQKEIGKTSNPAKQVPINLNPERRAVLKFWGIEAVNGLLVVHGQELIGTVELFGTRFEEGQGRRWRWIEMRGLVFGGL